MNRLRGLAILMGVVILAITGFQGYWLWDNYRRETKTLESRTDVLFRETVRDMRDSILQKKIQRVVNASASVGIAKRTNALPISKKSLLRQKETARVLNILGETLRDSAKKRAMKNTVAERGAGIFLRLSEGVDKDSLRHLLSLDSVNPDEIKEMVVVNATASRRRPVTMNLDSLPLHGSISVEKKATVSNHISSGTISFKDSVPKKSQAQFRMIYMDNGKGNRISLTLDSLINDSLPLKSLEAAFAGVLKKEKLEVPFSVSRGMADSASAAAEGFFPTVVPDRALGYQLQLGRTYPYLVKRISWPILFSFFLVSITIFSFILLYRSLLRQHRLAQMKNDLISNITHELKTPIATVGVAIEALKNFNAINDPERTKEYLDISQSELQRLGLLVDKVLKLSMFENKKIAIKYEAFNLNEVVGEVITSLRLQAEKIHARLTVTSEGDMTIRGDRLHLLSVVFNLLDNAMKYSKDNASIQVETKSAGDNVILSVTDNGIGIAPAYREKIFEKFFRVPTGDTHNAKGHGLGLSYVAQVIHQHGGTIGLSSQEGIGSIFTVTLPKQGAA